jgi:hypothetical protein
VFDNRVLRRIFGPKRDKGSGENLHSEELNDLYASSTILRLIKSRRMRWMGRVARMGRGEACTGFCGETEGKRPMGRPSCRWEDTIKMNLQEVGCGSMDWIGLAQDRDRWQAHLNAVINVRVP